MCTLLTCVRTNERTNERTCEVRFGLVWGVGRMDTDYVHAYMPTCLQPIRDQIRIPKGRWRQRAKVSRRVGTLADETTVVLRAVLGAVLDWSVDEASTRACGVGNRCAGREQHHWRERKSAEGDSAYTCVHTYVHTCVHTYIQGQLQGRRQ